MVDYINSPDLPRSPLPFSPAVRVGNLIFVSGQASVDDAGSIIPDTFEGEFRRSVENIRRILLAAGSDLDRVVQVKGYVRDPANLPLYNRLYREYYFHEPYPARSTLVHCLPETLQFELDCIAVAGDE